MSKPDDACRRPNIKGRTYPELRWGQPESGKGGTDTDDALYAIVRGEDAPADAPVTAPGVAGGEDGSVRAVTGTTVEPWRSPTCRGESCRMCGAPAAAKVGEEISSEDPQPNRHNLTAYVCAKHFVAILGSMAARVLARTDTGTGTLLSLEGMSSK